MKAFNLFTAGIILLPVINLTGCATFENEPVVYDLQYGQSVTQLKQAQLLNPEAAQNPPIDPPKRLDGDAGVIVIDGYREGFVSEGGDGGEDFTINIGNLGSGGN